MENIEQIGNYTITQSAKIWSEHIYFFENCENREGMYFDILTIKQTDKNSRKLKRMIDHEVKPIEKKDIKGFIKTVETGFENDLASYYIVYEHYADTTYDSYKNIDIKSVIEIAEGLNYFKTNDNSQKFIISPKYIKVDNNGDVKLMFAKLFDIFADEKLLEPDYLSPIANKYLEDKQLKPNIQDDIYSLVKTFEGFIKSNYPSDQYSLAEEILTRSLAEKRTDRFAKYQEIIDILNQLPSIKKKSYPKIKVVIKSESNEDSPELIESMNRNTWMQIESSRSDKDEVAGTFTTEEFNGHFFVKKHNYLFVNNFSHGKKGKINTQEDSFIAEFTFTQENSNYECVSFFEQKYQDINRLAKLHSTQKEELELWQKLPETEKEYIEKNAFKVKYSKKELSKNGERIIFFLNDDEKISWGKVRSLKDEKKVLFVNDIYVGHIHDWQSSDNTLSIASPKCNIDELPEQGELAEDIRQETSQFRKQVESCQKFLEHNVVNKELCDIIATPDDRIVCRSHNLDYDCFENQLYDNKLGNDPSQLEAVLEAISYKPIYLIQGPPGAGKTTVIVETIRQLVKQKKDIKILLTSQSNLAVDNVLEKLIDTDIPFVRLASDNAIENDSVSEKMRQHCYEEKLKKWISETENKSTNHFKNKYKNQEKQIELQDIFKTFEEAKATGKFDNFASRLDKSSNYVKQIFEKSNDFKTAENVFETQFGKDYCYLKKLQKDWFSFIDNSLTDSSLDGKTKKVMLNNGSQEIDFLTAMLMKTNVVGATCIHIASSKYSRINFNFDYVIMDESSKATPAESLVPLSMGHNVILIGDDKQLPPVITREEAVKQNLKEKLDDNGLDIDKTYGISLFEKIKKSFEQSEQNKRFVKMLDIQYRMPKQLGNLISKFFYDGKLKNPDFKDYDDGKRHGLNLKKTTSIVFINTSERHEHQDNGDKFKRQNKCNVDVIKNLLTKLNELYPDNLHKNKPFSIGIIAGYRGQVELLKQQINTSGYCNFVLNKKTLIEINTVDKFQGAERDIIIYDIVRSSTGHDNIGFLSDYRRINVAFSRAQRLLFIIGDAEYILKRASFIPCEDFPEFKLKQITESLQKEGLIFNNFNDIFNG